jgi:DtxR family Mn-dependent transcriptional regulator
MNSLSEENYLKAIYRLSVNADQKISLTTIAESVNVNTASALDMIKKLSVKKLIAYDKVNGANLTAKGMKAAVGIVRKHRLWEVFLVDKLGYSWDVVHEIAEQLEHIRHKELADRLDEFLGFPEFDPHGDPIPSASGEIPRRTGILLSELEDNKTCRVAAVKDTSPNFLQYLEKLDIRIGTWIKLVEKIPFDNSIRIQVGKGQQLTVSEKFAANLIVQ